MSLALLCCSDPHTKVHHLQEAGHTSLLFSFIPCFIFSTVVETTTGDCEAFHCVLTLLSLLRGLTEGVYMSCSREDKVLRKWEDKQALLVKLLEAGNRQGENDKSGRRQQGGLGQNGEMWDS